MADKPSGLFVCIHNAGSAMMIAASPSCWPGLSRWRRDPEW
jgi:hypothetical protein